MIGSYKINFSQVHESWRTSTVSWQWGCFAGYGRVTGRAGEESFTARIEWTSLSNRKFLNLTLRHFFLCWDDELKSANPMQLWSLMIGTIPLLKKYVHNDQVSTHSSWHLELWVHRSYCSRSSVQNGDALGFFLIKPSSVSALQRWVIDAAFFSGFTQKNLTHWCFFQCQSCQIHDFIRFPSSSEILNYPFELLSEYEKLSCTHQSPMPGWTSVFILSL